MISFLKGKGILFVCFLSTIFFLVHSPIFSQDKGTPETGEETLEAIVTKILEEKEVKSDFDNQTQIYQKLELEIIKGSLKGQKINLESGEIALINSKKYQVGNRLIVIRERDAEGNDFFYIHDYVRRWPLFSLFILFIIVVVLIAQKQGIYSLLGMVISFLVILKFVLPKILLGSDPITIAIIASFLIIPITFYLSHGFNKKTSVAILGTLISLMVIGVLSIIFVEITRLTGFVSEEAGFLQTANQGTLNVRGLLLAGIIIGSLGILDDITISQTAIVLQLKKTDPKIKSEELFGRAMNIGRDHISSMVNTLILVYTGASLPLLLLFINNPHPFLEIINYEIISEEIVRTLIGSIGLILSVPVTTFIATLVADRGLKAQPKKTKIYN